MMTLNEKFMTEISRVKEPEVFLGVARLLGVRLVEIEKDKDGKFASRDFTDIFRDVMEKFDGANRSKKKELLRLLRDANKFKGTLKESGEDNGNSTQNSEETISN